MLLLVAARGVALVVMRREEPPNPGAIELPPGVPVAITVVQQEAPPAFISQKNCISRGLTPEHFLKALRESQLPVASVGHLRLVETAVFDG